MNKTTIEYNETETELTLLVNEKHLHKYAFVQFEPEQGKNEHPCKYCAFDGLECEDVKCLWDRRKDRKDGFFRLIDNGN